MSTPKAVRTVNADDQTPKWAKYIYTKANGAIIISSDFPGYDDHFHDWSNYGKFKQIGFDHQTTVDFTNSLMLIVHPS